MTMTAQPDADFNRIPLSVVRRWAMKAAAVGFLTGFAAALGVLLAK
jgi:hypothetical protein